MHYCPQGQITRGKTARNRLRRSDLFMILTEGALLRMSSPPAGPLWAVDLGYGFGPYTTLESALNFRKINPKLPILGVEVDPERVATAKPFESTRIKFRLGGFKLPLEPGETVRMIRAFNVLRQYEESDFTEAIKTLGRQLIPGGILLEGTSDPFGRVWTANIVRRSVSSPEDISRVGFLFSTNFHSGFEPDLFQPVLTKNYIHQMAADSEIFEFIEDWKNACQTHTAFRLFGLRQFFTVTAHEMADRGWDIDLRPSLLSRGFLLWKFNKPL